MRLAIPCAAHHRNPQPSLAPAPACPLRFLRVVLSFMAAVLILSAAPPLHAQSWTLVWSDEFNASAGTYPDASKWTYDLGNSGFGNPEIENYCQPGSNTAPCVASQPNAYQDGSGNLVIQARRDSSGNWTSARLKTQGLYQFQYGKVEARMKLPVGDGLWPAFWMLGANINQVGWPQTGEQDIMEWVQSYTPTTTSSTTHGPGYSGANGIGARYTFPNGGRIDDGSYHTYGVVWSPNLLQYYRDDPSNVFLTLSPSTIPAGTQWVYNNPFFILLNLAIGSGGFPGPTDSSTPATANVLVDYVRVYQQSGTASLNGTHTLTPQNATGLRLDDQSAGTANGNPIDVYTANSSGAQAWSFSNNGVNPSGDYNLATEGAFCATASGTASGSAVNLQPCNGSPGQAWNIVTSGGLSVLHPASNTGLCLDVRGDGTSPGTLTQALTCSGGNNEQWAIQ